MTTTLNSGIAPNIATLLRTLAQITGKDIDLTNSSSFRAVLESSDGKALNFRVYPLDQGTPTTQNATASADLTIPSGGAPDLDGATGTATMAASTIAVTVPTPDNGVAVPVGSSVYATVATGAGKPKLLSAVRTSDTVITISSTGSGFGALLASAGVAATLVASEKADIALANVVGDLLAVELTTTGGTVADHFSVVRVSDSLVKVQAHTAAGALVAGNTALIKVYNLGQAAHETSTVRWAVVRP